MTLRPVSLDDKYDLNQSHVLVTGYQALIRACLMQKERDRQAGHNTGGYLTGYRGSPLGGLDQPPSRVLLYLTFDQFPNPLARIGAKPGPCRQDLRQVGIVLYATQDATDRRTAVDLGGLCWRASSGVSGGFRGVGAVS